MFQQSSGRLQANPSNWKPSLHVCTILNGLKMTARQSKLVALHE